MSFKNSRVAFLSFRLVPSLLLISIENPRAERWMGKTGQLSAPHLTNRQLVSEKEGEMVEGGGEAVSLAAERRKRRSSPASIMRSEGSQVSSLYCLSNLGRACFVIQSRKAMSMCVWAVQDKPTWTWFRLLFCICPSVYAYLYLTWVGIVQAGVTYLRWPGWRASGGVLFWFKAAA